MNVYIKLQVPRPKIKSMKAQEISKDLLNWLASDRQSQSGNPLKKNVLYGTICSLLDIPNLQALMTL